MTQQKPPETNPANIAAAYSVLERERIIPVAEIVAVHGLRGWVKLQPGTKHELLCACPSWYLRLSGGQWSVTKPEQCRLRRDRSLIKLAGSETRDQAQELIGAQIGLERQHLPKLEQNDYYWCDLVGLEVIDATGSSLGNVQSMFDTPANDVMEVGAQDKRILIPFAPSYIVQVDFSKGKIFTRWQLDY